jgi:2,2-dialkylglycine decarboxylase (pyruvate)
MLGLHLISPDVGAALSAKAFELGLNCNLVPLRELGGTIRIVPPLTVTEAELKKGLEILDEACKWVEMEMAA